MTHAERAERAHNEYVAACERFAACFDPLRLAFEGAMAEAFAVQARHGDSSEEMKAARRKVIDAMRAASGEPGSELADARDELDRTRDALRRATLGTMGTEEGPPDA